MVEKHVNPVRSTPKFPAATGGRFQLGGAEGAGKVSLSATSVHKSKFELRFMNIWFNYGNCYLRQSLALLLFDLAYRNG